MPINTILSPVQVLTNLKKRLQQANRDFAKYPNATHWNVQQRLAFTYQQAFYFLQSSTRTTAQKWDLLVDLSTDPLGNWGDTVCQHALGMTLQKALNEYAVNP